MSRNSYRKCSKCGATPTRDGTISFYRFPKPGKTNVLRARAWAKYCWPEKDWLSIEALTELFTTNKVLCKRHFEDDCFTEDSKKKKVSIPGKKSYVTKLLKSLRKDMHLMKKNDEAPHSKEASRICRVCLTVDSNMHDLGKFCEVFYNVTGLLAAERESCRLPQHLCWECAARLKSAASLKHKALTSDAILRALLKPNTCIKIPDIKIINRKYNGLNTSLVQKIIDPEHYDVKIQDTCADIEDKSKGYKCQSDTNIKTDILLNGIEKSNTKHLMLQNNDEESNDEESNDEECNDEESNEKFDILQNSGKESHVQYVIIQNGVEENVLKYLMLQNDNSNIQTEQLTIQNNNKVNEENEMSDEDMLEEYVYSDDDAIEIVGDSDIPEEISKIVHKENLKEFDIGVQNKTVGRVLKMQAGKMDNSRAVSGQTRINNENISKYENLYEITDLTFEQQREEIFRRQEQESYKNAPYKCTVCFAGFMEKSVFDRHSVKHTDANGKFECTICKTRKKKRTILNRHVAVSHSREYKCRKCDFVTRNSGVARAHLKYHKGKRYQCKQCPLVFDKCTTYLGHVRLNHVNSCVCEYCGYTFVSQRGVTFHKNLLHKLEKNVECEGPYCKECDVTFLSDDAYIIHLKLSSRHLKDESDPLRIRNEPTHATRKKRPTFKPRSKKKQPVIIKIHDPVTCEQCGFESPSYRSYAQHFLQRHPGLNRTQHAPAPTPCICEQCGEMFPSVTALSSHQWVHTEKEKYQCDHCDKYFAHKYTLKVHLDSIVSQPHQCSDCGKLFLSLKNLKRHQFIHASLEKFECHICSKKFITNDRLYQHKRHTHFNIPWPRRVRRS